MNREQIAVEVLKCAMSWAPGARLLGNVQAIDMVALAASVIDTCPKCGSTAWVNIDCDLCSVCTTILRGEEECGNDEYAVCERASKPDGKPCAAAAGHLGPCVESLALCMWCNRDVDHPDPCVTPAKTEENDDAR